MPKAGWFTLLAIRERCSSTITFGMFWVKHVAAFQIMVSSIVTISPLITHNIPETNLALTPPREDDPCLSSGYSILLLATIAYHWIAATIGRSRAIRIWHFI